MSVWKYFKYGCMSPCGGATGPVTPPTGRQEPICKKTNYIQIFGREGGPVAPPPSPHRATGPCACPPCFCRKHKLVT